MNKAAIRRFLSFCILILLISKANAQLFGSFSSCDPNPYPWYIGGNNLAPIAPANAPPHWTPPLTDIGTCNNFPFILKANNNPAICISTNGKVGIGLGHNNPLATLDVKDQSSFRIYSDAAGNVESSTHINLIAGLGKDLSFGEGSASSNSNRMVIKSGGNIGIGTLSPLDKLHVMNGNIYLQTGNLKVSGGNAIIDGKTIINSISASNQALSINLNSSVRFLTYGDGATHIATNLQVGFTNSSIQNVFSRLNLSCPGSSPNMEGLRITTDAGSTARMINVDNTSNQIGPLVPTTSVFGVYGNGRTVIGAEFPNNPANAGRIYMLAVNGLIGARAIKVSIQNPWPDYVFKNDYKLQSLESLEYYLDKNQHLPNIPSATDLNSDICGLDLAEMQGKQMEKIEEIFLHLIELNKQIKALKNENSELKKQLKSH